MKAEVHLRDTRDGRAAVYIDNWPEQFPGGSRPDAESVEYMWTEGNFGCDCNRLLMLCRALGVEDEEIACNTGDNVIVLDKLVVDGEEIDLL